MTFLACAAMLTSAIALNSCKSDDPIGYEGDAEVVKTEFAISLPNNVAGNGAKHMPSATVQPNGTLAEFQGMTGIMLVPFAKGGEILGTDSRLGAKNIRLADIAKIGGVSNDTLSNSSRAKVYTDVAIPLSTASFLFYGKSAATASGTAIEQKFKLGSLRPDTANAYTTPNNYSFKLDSILTAAQYTTLMSSPGASDLIAYLTSIANASDGEASPKLWRQYPNNGDTVPIYKMFQDFSSLKDLSSFQVSRMLTDLYKSLKPIRSSWKIADGIMKAIEDAPGHTYATVDANDTVCLVVNNFPQSVNIPEGAIGIKWVGSTTNAFQAYAMTDYDDENRTRPTKYVYPAELWYFANSTILTSKKSQKDEYNNTNTWETIKGKYTDGAAVNTLTRSVLLADSVQYAVARFDVQIKLANSTLADNSLAVAGVATDVDCSAKFPVTAIFVGGQKHAQFDFTPMSGTDYYTIYDNVMTEAGMEAGTSYSDMNHTLVLENDEQDVRIAVEMVNNTGVDFYGSGNQLIPKNSKFYVVASLDHTAATETGGKVFKQDFTTTARLNLKSLKNAYNTIPDLRTPQLEIGFAVDLSWRSGHDYNNIDIE